MPDTEPTPLKSLEELLRSNSDALDTHLECVSKDFPVEGTSTILHGHFIIVDQNGHDRMDRLAEAMRARITDYAIPRDKFREAQLKDLQSGTGQNVTYLHEEAKRLFTDLKNSGEGGELLLFMIAENILKYPQILCKMSLKTDSRDHFKGSDGVYVSVDDDSNLLLHWGESKIYNDIQDSIRDCLKSLAPFLLGPEEGDAERENDLLLLNTYANINDTKILNGLKNYLDKNHPQNRKLKYCGIALAGFTHDCYKAEPLELTIQKITEKIKAEVAAWAERVKGRVDAEKLQRFDIHFFCVAIPSSEKFREIFRQKLGIS